MFTRHRTAMNACSHITLNAASLLAAASLAASASTIAVTNLSHSNGWYSFDLIRNDAYFQLGGDALMRSLVLHTYHLLDAVPPASWRAQFDDSMLTFICTNDLLLGFTNALHFAFHSDIIAETLYDEPDVFAAYPQGVALGELHGPSDPVTPVLDGYVASVNAAAVERFSYLGPIIPEPAFLFTCCLPFFRAFALRRRTTPPQH